MQLDLFAENLSIQHPSFKSEAEINEMLHSTPSYEQRELTEKAKASNQEELREERQIVSIQPTEVIHPTTWGKYTVAKPSQPSFQSAVTESRLTQWLKLISFKIPECQLTYPKQHKQQPPTTTRENIQEGSNPEALESMPSIYPMASTPEEGEQIQTSSKTAFMLPSILSVQKVNVNKYPATTPRYGEMNRGKQSSGLTLSQMRSAQVPPSPSQESRTTSNRVSEFRPTSQEKIEAVHGEHEVVPKTSEEASLFRL